MTDEEQAEKLLDDIFELRLMGRTKEVAINAILTYADEIRRECADRAQKWITLHTQHVFESDDELEDFRAAIMSKEEGK